MILPAIIKYMEHWLLYSALSILVMSIFYVLTKKILNAGTDPILYSTTLQLSTGVLALIVALIWGFSFVFSPASIILLIIATIIYNIAPIIYYTGLQKVELSESIILESSGVFWAIMAGFILLHEAITPVKFAAALLIFIAILMISNIDFRKWHFSKYELMILASSIIYVLGAMVDKVLLPYSNPISYTAVSFLVAGLTMALIHFKHLYKLKRTKQINKGFILKLLTNAGFLVLNFTLIFSAYDSGGEASRVYAIVHLQVVIIALLGIIFLKERKHLGRKLLALVMAFIGIMMMGG